MGILLRIAVRNIIQNKKRAGFIGFAIFICCFLLLLCNAFMNSAQSQVVGRYRNIQSGDIAVVWSSLKNIKTNDPSRLLFTSPDNASFDVVKEQENNRALKILNKFVTKHMSDIAGFYPSIRRQGQFFTGNKVDFVLLNSLSGEQVRHLVDTGALTLYRGKMLSNGNNICLSREKAEFNDLDLGDEIEVSVTTTEGKINNRVFTITGIYNNGAGYDNYYGFISQKTAYELFRIDDGYFDIAHIFMKKDRTGLKTVNAAAHELDRELVGGGGVLRAETYVEASSFYTRTTAAMKLMFNVFIVFFMLIIAIGLRATIRMNLYERMKEFGTLRAIGFSRRQCYGIIFGEVFVLSAAAMLVALAVSTAIVLVLGKTGVYMGGGAMTYSFGGEYVYPAMRLTDILFTLLVIAALSVVSTVNPGLQLVYQKITDILLKRQRRIYPVLELFKSISIKNKRKSADCQ